VTVVADEREGLSKQRQIAHMSTSRPAQSPTASSFLAERKPSGIQQAKNPLSLRLSKALGTNFNDKATKDALETLSALYC
ncbi:hypothetical protein MMA87_24715, partial [Salmonella enterica]|nr:hypothetical protein [Salmonella enterica]